MSLQASEADEIARITIHNFDSFEDKVKSENEVAFLLQKTTAELTVK
jgi:hypothetical protein